MTKYDDDNDRDENDDGDGLTGNLPSINRKLSFFLLKVFQRVLVRPAMVVVGN